MSFETGDAVWWEIVPGCAHKAVVERRWWFGPYQIRVLEDGKSYLVHSSELILRDPANLPHQADDERKSLTVKDGQPRSEFR